MKKTVYEDGFVRAFDDMNRSDNFSVKARRALYNYIITMEEDACGDEYELDVIEICCTYSEYDSLEALQEDYPNIKTMDDAEERTSVVIWEDDCIVIQSY